MFFQRTKSLFSQFIFSCIMLLICSSGLHASEADTAIWKNANKLYEQKKFEEAKDLYLQLLAQGVSSSSLDYNLGNTYYRLNENPQSILFFERALRKSPHDKKTEENLKLAKERISHPIAEAKPIFFVLWWQGLVSFFGIPALALISLLIFLTLLTMLFFELSGKRTIPYFGRWFSAVALLFIFFILLYFSGRNLQMNNEAIILKEKTPFFVDPQSEKAEIFIPAGTKVQIEKEKEKMFYVELPNGAEGWIEKHFAEKIAE